LDLKSRSGTFYNGTYLSSGVERELEEGVPIAIGMSVISIGGRPVVISHAETLKEDELADRLKVLKIESV
jgi:pSer/pThr/pTyr-binding forkhead associated (FHA) protein